MGAEKEIICSPEAFWKGGTPCVIWCASPEDRGTAFLPYLQRPCFHMAADGGWKKAAALGITPDMLVGDFDSLPELPLEAGSVLRLPKEKDDTDLQACVKEGLARGFRHFLLVGCTGGRLDHFLSVLSVLAFLEKEGARGMILAEGNRIFWAEGPFAAVIPNDPAFPYFSLQPMDEKVLGVTIRGAKYPLMNHTLYRAASLGISNEVSAEAAAVSARKGALLIILSNDKKGG